MCNFDTIEYGNSSHSAGRMPSQVANGAHVPNSSSPRGLFDSSWADEVEEGSNAKEDPNKKAPGKEKDVAGNTMSTDTPEGGKQAEPANNDGFYSSRHADPNFEIPAKDAATKTKWAAPAAPSVRVKSTAAPKQPQSDRSKQGGARAASKGNQNGGMTSAATAPRTAPSKSNKYPTKTAVYEADYQKAHDRYLDNLKGFRSEQEIIDALMGVWLGATVVVLPDGTEVLASEYSSAASKK